MKNQFKKVISIGLAALFAATTAMSNLSYAQTDVSERYIDQLVKATKNPFVMNLTENESISPFQGNLSYSQTDLSLKGRNGLDFNLTRDYSSQESYQLDFSSEGVMRDNPNETFYDIGAGWAYNLPYLKVVPDTNGANYDLNLGSGGSFFIERLGSNKDSQVVIKDYDKKSFNVFIDINAYSNGSEQSVITLRYADGTSYYFSDKGYVLGIRDKYNNRINFEYQTIAPDSTAGVNTYFDRYRLLRVTDSVDRVINFSYSTNETAISVTGSGKTKTIKYQFKRLVDVTTLRPQTTNLFISTTDKVLDKVIDENGLTTQYSYDYKLGKKQFYSKIMDNTANADYIYALLSQVSYPGGANTYYEYIKSTKNLGIGCMEFFKVAKRYDKTGPVGAQVTQNTIQYNYALSAGIEFDGYPKNSYTVENDPKFQYRVSVTDLKGTNEYIANNKMAIIRVESSGPDYKTVEKRSYNDKNDLTAKSKNIYDYTTPDGYFTTATESYQYDETGNLIGYWGPLSERKAEPSDMEPANDEHKVTTTFDARFNIPTSKSYKTSSTVNIVETNVLTADGKAIASNEIRENGVLKKKVDFEYDGYGNCIHQIQYKDGANNPVHQYFSYSGSGKYSQVNKIWTGQLKDVDGKVIDPIEQYIEYDDFGNAVSQKDGKGNITAIQYDILDRPIKVTNPDNSFGTIQYNTKTDGFELVKTDENNNAFKLTYDGLGRQISVAELKNNKILSTNTYDIYGQVSKVTDALGNYTTFDYFTDGQLKEKKSFSKIGTLLSHVKYTRVFGVNSKYTEIKETVYGDYTSPTQEKIYYYNNIGQVDHVAISFNNATWTEYNKYDYAGRQTEFKSAKIAFENLSNPYTWKKEYDYAGNVLKTYNTNGDYTKQTFNSLGQVLETYDFKSNAAGGTYSLKSTYDDAGRLIQQEVPFDIINGQQSYQTKRFYYDANSKITKELTSINKPDEALKFAEKVYSYDTRGRLSYAGLKNNGVDTLYSQYYYDAVGNTLRTYTGLSAPLNISALDTVSGSDMTFSVAKYEYDNLGNVTKYIDPMGQSETYEYDDNGNLIKRVDRNKTTFSMAYDGLNRLVSRNTLGTDGSTSSYLQSYSLAGQLKSTTLNGLVSDYRYDELGHLTGVSGPGHSNSYTYDISGNKVRAISAYDIDVTYKYDALDRMVEVYRNNTLEATYSYDTNGNRISLKYKDGSMGTNYTFNQANMLTGLDNFSGSESTANPLGISNKLSDYTYAYRLDGNRLSETDSSKNSLRNFSYDDLSRLISESKQNNGQTPEGLQSLLKPNEAQDTVNDFNTSYTFDDYGNIQTKVQGASTTTYTYDKNNRVVSEVTVASGVNTTVKYSYDPNGNTISERRTVTAAQGSEAEKALLKTATPYVKLSYYNHLNQLVKVSTDKGTFKYEYNDKGLRISKSGPSGKMTYSWDGDKLVAEFKEGFGLKATYLYGVGGQIHRKDALTGKVHYYFYNGHGDVTALADGTGKISTVYDYNAYGEVNIRGENIENPFRYFGQYYDEETGSYYLRARYYDPSLMRFTNEDTYQGKSEDPLSLNKYLYCIGNPVGYVDESGNVPTMSKDSGASSGYFLIGGDGNLYSAKISVAGGKAFINPVDSEAYANSFKYELSQHEMLDMLGFVPVIGMGADVANGLLYQWEGDNGNANISYAAVAIDGASIARNAKKLEKVNEFLEAVSKGVGKTVFKNINEGLNFATTPAKHMDNPGRYVPVEILKDAILSTKGVADPKGSNALMHYTTMYRGYQKYNLEVLYDEATNTIYHFEYTRESIGGLPAIPKVQTSK